MNYSFAKTFNGLGVVIGWVLIALGLAMFVATYQDGLDLALSVGGLMVVFGFCIIALCQLSQAVIQTAEESATTNQLLQDLLKQGSSQVSLAKLQVPAPQQNELELIKSYKGYRIDKKPGTRIYFVEGQPFDGLPEAEQHIDNLAS